MLNFKSSRRRGASKGGLGALSGTRSLNNASAPKKSNLHKNGEASASSLPGLTGTFLQQTQLGHLDKRKQPERGKSTKINPLRTLGRVGIVLGAIIILTIGLLATKTYLTSQKIFDDNQRSAIALNLEVDPSELSAEGDGRINVLLAGKGGATHQDGGDLTDSLVIASVDPFSKRAALLSVPRDLYVDVEGFWSMKINAAYAVAKTSSYDQSGNVYQAEVDGINTLADTIETYIGIPIHYYILVDFVAFESVIDTIGGLEIDVATRLYDPTLLPEIFLDIYPGQQVLDGETALTYVRSRATSPRGDFDRSQRQREVLLALRNNLLSAQIAANPIKLSKILDTIGDHVRTNLRINEATKLYDIISDIEPDHIGSLSFVDDPVLVTTSVIGDQSVVIPRAGINDYRAIRAFVRNTLVDGFIQQEGATITVLNGSGITNLASRRAAELEEFGYNVVEVANAPTTNYLSTVLIANSQLPYTQKYLENRLDLGAIYGSPPGGGLEQYTSDFVIIIGIDESVAN